MKGMGSITIERPLWAGWTEIIDGDRAGGWGVYALANRVTGRVLISGSNDVAKRLWDVRRCLGRGHHWNRGVQADLDQYGTDAFKLYWVLGVQSATLLKIVKFSHQQRAADRGLSYHLKPVYRSKARRPTPVTPPTA
jgi:hypothetical protein